MARIEEGIGRYIFGYDSPPKKTDLVVLSDKTMALVDEMEKFINLIDDDRKREVMKKNLSLMQQLLVDNLETYSDWVGSKQ